MAADERFDAHVGVADIVRRIRILGHKLVDFVTFPVQIGREWADDDVIGEAEIMEMDQHEAKKNGFIAE